MKYQHQALSEEQKIADAEMQKTVEYLNLLKKKQLSAEEHWLSTEHHQHLIRQLQVNQNLLELFTDEAPSMALEVRIMAQLAEFRNKEGCIIAELALMKAKKAGIMAQLAQLRAKEAWIMAELAQLRAKEAWNMAELARLSQQRILHSC